jgi:hypothetical protein
MTPFARIATVGALASVVAACGQSPQQQQAEQIQKNAQQLAQNAAQISGNAQDVFKGFEAMARGMAAAATNAANVQLVDPGRYKKDDFEVTEKITDSGFNQLLVAPISMMLAAGYAVTVFVSQRFLVELEGSGMSDNKELQAFLARTDLKKLAAIK